MVITARTTAPAQTQELAAALAALCGAGDLLLLVGDLGAGKTAFTQGFGRGFGVEEPITSPTFTLANEYQGRLVVHHLDVYRIEQLEDVRDLAIPELLDGQAVTLIEWGDQILPVLPGDYLEVRLTYGDGDDDRAIELDCVGARWMARKRAVAEAVAPWQVSPC